MHLAHPGLAPSSWLTVRPTQTPVCLRISHSYHSVLVACYVLPCAGWVCRGTGRSNEMLGQLEFKPTAQAGHADESKVAVDDGGDDDDDDDDNLCEMCWAERPQVCYHTQPCTHALTHSHRAVPVQ